MMTHNEKMNRAGIFNHYAHVIDGLFAAGESGASDVSSTDSQIFTESEISVAAVIRVIQSVSKSVLSLSATTDISR